MRFSVSYGQLIAILVCVFVISIQFLIKQKTQLPSFVIDLDKDPQERWKEVAEKYAESFRIGAQPFLASYQKKYNISLVELKRDVEYLSKQLPEEYRQEIIGFANYMKISDAVLFLLQIKLDFSMFSTTAICSDYYNMIWTFKSVDSIFDNTLKLLAITVDFHKDNRSVYKGNTFAGLVGLVIGMRRDKYSITADPIEAEKTFEAIFQTASEQANAVGNIWPVSLFTRRLLSRSDCSFDDVVREVSKFPFMDPFYFIVGGRMADKGVMITRNRRKVVEKRQLNTLKGQWFLTIINRLNESAASMKVMKETINELSRYDMTEENVWHVVKAVQGAKTLFTTVMCLDSYLLSSMLIYSQ